jgi:hypothetical protein
VSRCLVKGLETSAPRDLTPVANIDLSAQARERGVLNFGSGWNGRKDLVTFLYLTGVLELR